MTQVARSGLAALGAGGLEFKSPRPDHFRQHAPRFKFLRYYFRGRLFIFFFSGEVRFRTSEWLLHTSNGLLQGFGWAARLARAGLWTQARASNQDSDRRNLNISTPLLNPRRV